MWTEMLDDGFFRVKNIPAWFSNLSKDDVVSGRRKDSELWYQATRRCGGHSTYRIAFQDPTALLHLNRCSND